MSLRRDQDQYGESSPLLEKEYFTNGNGHVTHSPRAESNANGRESNGGVLVTCKVCKNSINIAGRFHQHVIKCERCKEATPIRAPPPGKKYIRCPCNCLLICKAAALRVACPRTQCKRVITLSLVGAGTATRAPPGTCRVICAYCSSPFMFNTLVNKSARCPCCERKSSVGSKYAKSHAACYLYSSLLFMAIAVGIMVGTWSYALESRVIGLIVTWIVLMVVSLVLLVRAFCFASMRISRIEGPL